MYKQRWPMYSKEGWQGLHSALAGIMKDKNEK